MVTFKQILANGQINEFTEARPSLARMQALVGGYIEVVRLRDRANILVVDEEGILNRKPINEVATAMTGFPIVGDVLVMRSEDLE